MHTSQHGMKHIEAHHTRSRPCIIILEIDVLCKNGIVRYNEKPWTLTYIVTLRQFGNQQTL